VLTQHYYFLNIFNGLTYYLSNDQHLLFYHLHG
jgi:hypothetical protein